MVIPEWARDELLPGEQLQHWSVCQICGRCAPRGTDGWIDAPRRVRGPHYGKVFRGKTEPLRVVRCPEHWSEWALRISIGRTNANRLRMQEVRQWEKPTSHPAIDPFPLVDQPIDTPVYNRKRKDRTPSGTTTEGVGNGPDEPGA